MRTWVDKSYPLYKLIPENIISMQADAKNLILKPFLELSIKFDGELNYAVKHNGKVYLLNKHKYGRIRTDCPITDELALNMSDDSILIGELVYGNGKDYHAFQQNKLTDNLNFFVFQSLSGHFSALDTSTHVKLVPMCRLSLDCFMAKKELESNTSWVFAAGYEGVVLFDGISKFAKIKRKSDSDLVILGYETDTTRAKDLSLWLGYKTDSGYEPLCFCANGLTDAQKIILKKVLSDFVTGKNKTITLVKPELIVTVEHQGVIYEDNKIHSIRMPIFKDFRFDKSEPDDAEKILREESISMPKIGAVSLANSALYMVSYADILLQNNCKILILDKQYVWANAIRQHTFYRVHTSYNGEACICNRNCGICDFKFKCVFEEEE